MPFWRGRRNRRLRAVRGLAQERLADSAGISKAAYRNIEGRRSVPRVDTLHRLAEALEVPIQDLVTPTPELRRVRFRSFRRLNTREQILLAVGRWLSDFNELEGLLGERAPFTLAQGNGARGRRVPSSPPEAAAHARERLGLGPEEPVRDICGLLEAHGVAVEGEEISLARGAEILGFSLGEMRQLAASWVG
jgi:transcriptional regulator with XRE-family HTH domain